MGYVFGKASVRLEAEKPCYICVIGGPGSGKTTQSRFIYELFDFAHLSSGQILRQYIANKKLQNGEYRIEVNGKMFSFYVSKDETDSSDKKPIKAIYHQYENETYGTTDNVISLIVDLRNNKNMRIDLNNNLDKIQIKLLTKTNYLNEEFYNTSLILGPEKGLFTLIANIKKVGEYSIEIYYNNYKMTSRNIKIYISCGVINKLNVLKEPKYYNGIGTYTFFEVFDINGENAINILIIIGIF
jgi:ABC-type oligopeptide transport system ATPase subunit